MLTGCIYDATTRCRGSAIPLPDAVEMQLCCRSSLPQGVSNLIWDAAQDCRHRYNAAAATQRSICNNQSTAPPAPADSERPLHLAMSLLLRPATAPPLQLKSVGPGAASFRQSLPSSAYFTCCLSICRKVTPLLACRQQQRRSALDPTPPLMLSAAKRNVRIKWQRHCDHPHNVGRAEQSSTQYST